MLPYKKLPDLCLSPELRAHLHHFAGQQEFTAKHPGDTSRCPITGYKSGARVAPVAAEDHPAVAEVLLRLRVAPAKLFFVETPPACWMPIHADGDVKTKLNIPLTVGDSCMLFWEGTQVIHRLEGSYDPWVFDSTVPHSIVNHDGPARLNLSLNFSGITFQELCRALRV